MQAWVVRTTFPARTFLDGMNLLYDRLQSPQVARIRGKARIRALPIPDF
jgi:hypothetical protein